MTTQLIDWWIKSQQTGRHNPSFYRELYKLPKDQQGKIWEELKQRGYSQPTKSGTKKSKKIEWTVQEWETFISLCWTARIENPALTISELIELGQSNFPQNRRRPQSHYLHREVVERLKERYINADKGKTKEQILDELTTEEIVVYFTDIVLENLSENDLARKLSLIPLPNLAAHLVKELLKPRIEQGERHHISISKPPTRLPKVLIAGPIRQQVKRIYDDLKGKAVVHILPKDKNTAAIPESYDYYVVWTKFMNHSLENRIRTVAKDRLIRFDGGLEGLIHRIEELT